jgi:formylglycine-generating enzyme required for sulfatase activity
LVRIPAVEFVMGSEKTETSFYNKQAISTTCGDNERPAHVVQLGEYLIDKHEVTNGQYRMFCDATHTKYPQDPYFPDMLNYFRDYPDYPVMSVSWEDAAAYCRWADKRLPTEAEWEQAARGMDRRPYPWGRENPLYTPKQRFDGYLDSSHQYSAPVGSYPNGASPYGILDMAGNVQEWCNDWYGEGYYAVSPEMNPQGPASGTMRVIRGGSKQLFVFERCAARMFFTPKTYKYGDKYYYYPFTGFRCAIGCK